MGGDMAQAVRESTTVANRRRGSGRADRGIRMFREWGLEHLLGSFPAHNTLELRVDGETRLFGADPYTSQFSAQLVPQRALVVNLIKDLVEDGGDLVGDAAHVISPMGAACAPTPIPAWPGPGVTRSGRTGSRT
jgi:p-hydroxybenzoate 3-monooxygenase